MAITTVAVAAAAPERTAGRESNFLLFFFFATVNGICHNYRSLSLQKATSQSQILFLRGQVTGSSSSRSGLF